MDRNSKIALSIIALALIGIFFYNRRSVQIDVPPANIINTASGEAPQIVTFEGMSECLPHKDNSISSKNTCEFGIVVDDSTMHYAVDEGMLANKPANFHTGTHIRVQGILAPTSELSTDTWQKFSINGIIAATSIEKI